MLCALGTGLGAKIAQDKFPPRVRRPAIEIDNANAILIRGDVEVAGSIGIIITMESGG